MNVSQAYTAIDKCAGNALSIENRLKHFAGQEFFAEGSEYYDDLQAAIRAQGHATNLIDELAMELEMDRDGERVKIPFVRK